MTVRTDVHRPGAIVPADYEFVAHEFLKVEDLGDAEFLRSEREALRRHMARTGGTYSHHEHGGNCMVCGSVNAVYTILFYHRPSNVYVRMGSDCAQKCEMGGDFDNSVFRHAVLDARLAQAGKKKAQAILGDEGLTAAWDIAMNGPSMRTQFEEQTITDIVGKLVKYGDISVKQMGYLHTLLGRIETRVQRDAEKQAAHEAAADCPTGRVTVEGTVLSVKAYESAYGVCDKMTILAGTGFKVWGTVPSKLIVNRGDMVSFTATVSPSPDDKKFGFFKRPTNANVVAAMEAVAA